MACHVIVISSPQVEDLESMEYIMRYNGECTCHRKGINLTFDPPQITNMIPILRAVLKNPSVVVVISLSHPQLGAALIQK